MANRSQVPAPFPAPRSHEPIPPKSKASLARAPQDTAQDPAQDTPRSDASQNASKVSSVGAPGPRKLIRPILPAKMRGNLRGHASVFTTSVSRLHAPPVIPCLEDSHAETFYLQKQVQAQTLMAIVLEGGEQIEGYIEWYDRDAIKIRHGSRTLIYKSSIKYLYKAAESVQT